MTENRVFVYGTLKPGEENYQRYCAGKTLNEQQAIALGTLFDLPLGYPALTEGNSPIEGVVLTFAESSILKVLDELEDYQPHRSPQHNEYNREQIEVFTLDRQRLGQVWAYRMSIEQALKQGGIWLPEGKWTGQPHLAY